jgi:hypothetical protein
MLAAVNVMASWSLGIGFESLHFNQCILFNRTVRARRVRQGHIEKASLLSDLDGTGGDPGKHSCQQLLLSPCGINLAVSGCGASEFRWGVLEFLGPEANGRELFRRRAGRQKSAFHLWTPPFRQGKTLGSLLRVVGCCHLSGL